MAKTKYYAELSESERSLLTKILCEGKVPDRTLMRSKILLMSGAAQKEKVSIRELAERLGTTETTIKTVRTEYAIVFTSNKNPALWRGNFNEDDALLCALDRIFDEATVFKIKGESFRGKKLETVALQTSKVKAAIITHAHSCFQFFS